MLDAFLDPTSPSLKICGVTLAADADMLVEHGVEALGVNFWPQSKRYLDPARADFLHDLAGRILRVGVFVNATTDLPVTFFHEGLIDAVQLHGDEPESDIPLLQRHGIPVIRSLHPDAQGQLSGPVIPGADAILLDAHAPDTYGGTGRTIDWDLAAAFISRRAALPVILAGGITPDNAAQALAHVRPAAIDIASGAESSPGQKDPEKVRRLAAAIAAAR